MNESTYTANVGRLLRKDHGVYAWKVADRYTAGVPDSWYSGKKSDLWVEWKYKKVLQKHVEPDLSALQARWLKARHHEGRNVLVIVASPEGCVIFGTPEEWTSGLSKEKAIDRTAVIGIIVEMVGEAHEETV